MNCLVPATVESAFGKIEQIEKWPPGQIIFREGEEPRGIFRLYSGAVALSFSARSGLMKALRTVIPGEIVGLSDAISNTPHDCTATARTSAKIGFVPIAALRHELEDAPALWFGIAEYLSADLESCWESMRTRRKR